MKRQVKYHTGKQIHKVTEITGPKGKAYLIRREDGQYFDIRVSYRTAHKGTSPVKWVRSKTGLSMDKIEKILKSMPKRNKEDGKDTEKWSSGKFLTPNGTKWSA